MQIALKLKGCFFMFLKNEVKELLQPTNKFWKITNSDVKFASKGQYVFSLIKIGINWFVFNKIWFNSSYTKKFLSFQLHLLKRKVIFNHQMIYIIQSIIDAFDYDKLFDKWFLQMKILKRKIAFATKYTGSPLHKEFMKQIQQHRQHDLYNILR